MRGFILVGILAAVTSCDRQSAPQPDAKPAAAPAEKSVAATAALMTRNVKVEPENNPQFPDARCGGPTRIHNYNNVPVLVDYTLFYEGTGPDPVCKAKWSSPEKIRLERFGDTREHQWLGCAQYQHEGSPCIEHKSWEVTLAQPTHLTAEQQRQAHGGK